MLGLLWLAIGVVIICAIVYWFFQKVPLQPPLSYVVYGVVAVVLIAITIQIFFGGGLEGLRLGNRFC